MHVASALAFAVVLALTRMGVGAAATLTFALVFANAALLSASIGCGLCFLPGALVVAL